MSSVVFKYFYFFICAFFLYVIYMTKVFATVLPEDFDCVYGFSFTFQTLSSIVCILLFLPSVIRSRHTQHQSQPVKNRVYFIITRLCAGFFFAFGSCYFFNGIAISQKFLNTYKTNITPEQVGSLAVLTISLLFFLLFFRLPKLAMLSFFGIFLFLLGNNSIYYADILSSKISIMRLVLPESDSSGNGAFIFKVTHLFLFVLFWSLTVKINQLASRFFKNYVGLWFETLLLNCLASFLLLLYSGNGPAFADRIMHLGIKCILYPPTVLFGAFLWFSIKAICIFNEKVTLGMKVMLLDKWISSVFTLFALLLLYDYHLVTFLIKVSVVVVGMYLFWKQKPVLLYKFKLTGRGRIGVFYVSSLLFAPVLVQSVSSLFYSLLVVVTGISDIVVEKSPVLLKALPPFLAGALLTVIATAIKLFLIGSQFLEHNFFASCFLLACFLAIYFYQYHTFETGIELLLRYAFGCLVSLIAIGFIEHYDFLLAIDFISQYDIRNFSNLSNYLPEIQAFFKENELNEYLRAFLLLSVFGFSFYQGIQKGKRLLIWTIVSNLLLYLSLSEAVYYGLAIPIGADVLHLFDSGDIAPIRFIIHMLLSSIPLLILLLLLLVSRNKSIEEKVLPSLLRCRLPWESEKRKVDEVAAILREKGLWSGLMPIQIYISQILEMNAYTIGNEAIAITYPLFHKLSSQQIAGIISHELGHIQHSDGRLQVFLYILNLPSTLILKIFKSFSFRQTPVITTLGCVLLYVLAYTNSLTLLGSSCIGGLMMWCLLQAAIFLMKNLDTQESEWQADAFAVANGLGKELKDALVQMAETGATEPERETWMEKYPDIAERIQRLDRLQQIAGA